MKASVAAIGSAELDDEGKLKNVDELKKSAKEEWADFIVSTGSQGAYTPNPPANTGGHKMTKEQIMGIKDAEARQKAMLDNPEAFGI